jgi:hypothetical protein
MDRCWVVVQFEIHSANVVLVEDVESGHGRPKMC